MNADTDYAAIFKTPVGVVGIRLDGKKITSLTYLRPTYPEKPPQTLPVKNLILQLDSYFKNPNTRFDNIDLKLLGTSLQKKIWCALREIPAGQTLTYGEMAAIIKTHPRVIGQTCRRNPIPIIIPCHRIVAKNSLGGYCGNKKGAMLNYKQLLIAHEKICQTP